PFFTPRLPPPPTSTLFPYTTLFRSHLSRAVELDPKISETHHNLGLALAAEQDYKRALFHFSEALRLNPRHPDAEKNIRQARALLDRKSTRLNSSHLVISYAVFCLKK